MRALFVLQHTPHPTPYTPCADQIQVHHGLPAGQTVHQCPPSQHQLGGVHCTDTVSTSGSESPDQVQGSLINAAADVAVSRAAAAIQASRTSIYQLVSANLRSTPLHSQQGKTKRKCARTATDQSASRGPGKGLRHFSLKVCEKVEAKGRTTYEKVANELVTEMSKGDGGVFDAVPYDEKNIRRRVYDAINVLLAMGIIEKEKKEITWKGFQDTSGSQVERLKAERQTLIAEAEKKQCYLQVRVQACQQLLQCSPGMAGCSLVRTHPQELIEQHQALQQLLKRNPGRIQSEGGTALHLPFILVAVRTWGTWQGHGAHGKVMGHMA